MRFCGGSVIPQTQNGLASPPPDEGHPPVPKVVGRTEGEEEVADEVVGGDNLLRSAIIVGIGSVVPPSIGRAWEGSTTLGELGTQGWLHLPVQQRSQARWHSIRSWPLTVGDGKANGGGNDGAGLPPKVARTAYT
jgi:hypothetical protein